MTFDNQTQISKYIAGIKDLLRLFYGTKALNSAYRKKLEAKLDGFIAADLLIDLISEKELQKAARPCAIELTYPSSSSKDQTSLAID
jgi:hypothetical protein